MRVWDAGTGQRRPALTGHTDAVTSVAFSPDGKPHRHRQRRQDGAGVGRGHRPGIGQPLNGHTGRGASAWRSARTASASPPAAGDQTVRLWDAATGQPVGPPLNGHTGRGVQRGVQPGRAAHGLRQRRHDGAAVGRDHRRNVGSPLTGHTGRLGGERGVQPRRKHHRVRRLRPDRAPVAHVPRPLRRRCGEKLEHQLMSHKQWRDWISPDIDYIKVCPDLPRRTGLAPCRSPAVCRARSAFAPWSPGDENAKISH